MTQRLIVIIACTLLLNACSTKHYRDSADKEVAGIIAQKTPLVPNMDTNFSIVATNQLSLDQLEVFDKSEEAFGQESDLEKGARMISLEEALEIAVNQSDEYQTRKESLYFTALDLTQARFKYTPIFSGSFFGKDNHQMEEIDKMIQRVDPVTHQPVVDADGQPVMDKVGQDFKDNQNVQAGGSISAKALLRTGGEVTATFTSDFLKIIGGDTSAVTHSALLGELTQPLLRNAGYVVAMETLTQSERNMLYALRDFTRYRKDFCVSIAADYYNVLQSRDSVRNNWRGLQNYRQNVIRERAYFDADRRSQASVDQLKQAELQTEADWIAAIRNYHRALDRFKIRIGLHTDDRIILDNRELERLKIVHPSLSIDEAVNVAMVNRLDLDTQRDQLADSKRHIKVAANALLPQLNLTADVNIARESSNILPVPDWQRYSWSVGLGLDLPLNRNSERNNYRTSQIQYERSKRSFNLAVENIKVQIADDWRSLDEAKRSYEIRELGVQIASRRVDEQRLRQEIGLGNSRDLVDAQSALIDSENQRTAALVNHTIARLGFYRDMGVLWVRANGQWDENPPAKK